MNNKSPMMTILSIQLPERYRQETLDLIQSLGYETRSSEDDKDHFEVSVPLGMLPEFVRAITENFASQRMKESPTGDVTIIGRPT